MRIGIVLLLTLLPILTPATDPPPKPIVAYAPRVTVNHGDRIAVMVTLAATDAVTHTVKLRHVVPDVLQPQRAYSPSGQFLIPVRVPPMLYSWRGVVTPDAPAHVWFEYTVTPWLTDTVTLQFSALDATNIYTTSVDLHLCATYCPPPQQRFMPVVLRPQ
jgi:hypothetical protein